MTGRTGVGGRTPLRPPRVGIVSGTVLAAVLLAVPASVAGQTDEGALRSVADEVARAWSAGDVNALSARLGADGVSLHTPEGEHPALSARLARAALDDLHATLGAGPAELRRVRLLGGSPMRGFAEIAWTPRVPDMSETVSHTVFVGLERTDRVWTIVEIRVLPGGSARHAAQARPDRPVDKLTEHPTEHPWR